MSGRTSFTPTATIPVMPAAIILKILHHLQISYGFYFGKYCIILKEGTPNTLSSL